MNIDVYSIIFLQSLRNPIFDIFALSIALFFNWLFMIALTFSIYIFSKKKESFLAFFGLIGTSISVLILKLIFMRPRPEYTLYPNLSMVVSSNFSFPSGHTAIAFYIAYLISKYKPQYSKTFYTLAFIVGMTRIYLGVHYLSDVIAGAILGLLVGYFSIRNEKIIFKLSKKINRLLKSILK